MLEEKQYFFYCIKKSAIKIIDFFLYLLYTNHCCDMIAVKREVAAARQVFRGANVKAGINRQMNLATSHCTNINHLHEQR